MIEQGFVCLVKSLLMDEISVEVIDHGKKDDLIAACTIRVSQLMNQPGMVRLTLYQRHVNRVDVAGVHSATLAAEGEEHCECSDYDVCFTERSPASTSITFEEESREGRNNDI